MVAHHPILELVTHECTMLYVSALKAEDDEVLFANAFW